MHSFHNSNLLVNRHDLLFGSGILFDRDPLKHGKFHVMIDCVDADIVKVTNGRSCTRFEWLVIDPTSLSPEERLDDISKTNLKLMKTSVVT